MQFHDGCRRRCQIQIHDFDRTGAEDEERCGSQTDGAGAGYRPELRSMFSLLNMMTSQRTPALVWLELLEESISSSRLRLPPEVRR